MAAWYKTGTVNVSTNSQTVIGVGANFISNCRAGDAFKGPDGAWYEVLNIASDTSISIFPSYKGPALNGGTYMLAPMQGYVKEAADRLRMIVDQFGDALADLAGKNVVVTVAGVAAASTNNDVPVAGLKTALGIDNLQPKETGKGLSSNDYTTTEKNKLAGIAAGATVNAADAALVSRANHTGTQLASTISDFAASVRSTAITGVVFTAATAIVAADSVLAALGKLQAQITAASTALAGNVRSTVLTGLSVGSSAAVAATDSVLVGIGKLQAQITEAGTALAANVRGTALTGLSVASSAAVVAADSILTGIGKLQAQITEAGTALAANVRGTVLTGLSLSSAAAVTATDSLIAGIGKLQAQITEAGTALAASVRGTLLTGLSTASADPVAATDSVLVGFGKLQAQTNLSGWGVPTTLASSSINGRTISGAFWLTSGTTDSPVLPGTSTSFTSGSGAINAIATAQISQTLIFSRLTNDIVLRRKNADVWQADDYVMMLGSSERDPALGSGGIVGTSTVSGFTLTKYMGGLLVIQGSLSATPSIAAGSTVWTDLTIPSGILATATANCLVGCIAATSTDHYGVTGAYMSTVTNLRYLIRNGPTAQTFALRITIIARWK